MKTIGYKVFTLAALLALLFGAFPASTRTVQAATPTELFFSEYIEGSSNNKALEIYNGTGAAVNLATGGYKVTMYFNGSSSVGTTVNLTGTVAAGDVYVLAQSFANATILAQADQTSSASWYNGDDAVVLSKGTTIIDVIGQIGFDPGTEWGTGLISTADNTLRRMNTICTGDPNGSDTFDPSLEWEGFATDTFGGLGSHTANCSAPDAAPEVTGSYPTNGATGIPLSADLNITFSEPVNVVGAWYGLSCTVSGPHTAAVSTTDNKTFTINPDTNFVGGEICTWTVDNSKVTDLDNNDPPDFLVGTFQVGFTTLDVCTQPFTPIPDIQGSGATVALTGTRTTQGVVVGDYEGASPALRGFFIQDPAGDANPATSDGIFVFEGSNANTVSLGDVVRVTGTAGENQGQSQISAGTIVKCGTGTVTPTDVSFPVASADALEQYEGMLVHLPQTMNVTEIYQLGRFGEVLLSANARLKQPTNVFAPGDAANELQAQNNLNQILIDDASQAQNPDPIVFARGGAPLSATNTLRGGDTATGIVGVLNYTWGGQSSSPNAYRIRPINAMNGYVDFEPANARPASAPNVGGRLKFASFNVLNYFLTLDIGTQANCGPIGFKQECRGAESDLELTRQQQKLNQALIKLNADVVGMMELENTQNAQGQDVNPLADIVARLNASLGGDVYSYIDTGIVGTDTIRVGIIYKVASVTPVGMPMIDTDPIHNRPPVAQVFTENQTGERVTVIVNHFKSKGCPGVGADADQLDGQGCFNNTRVLQAQRLVNYINDTVIPTAGDPDVLLLGDFNSYAKEDPIAVLEAAGFTNLVANFNGSDAYSYVFDGQWGYLDQGLASAGLVDQAAGAADYHINSDEPSVLDYNTNFKSAGQIDSFFAPDEFRTSDHDPVVVGLNLNLPPTVSAGGPYTVNEGSQVTLTATATDPDSYDTLTYNWDLNGDGTYETPGASVSFTGVDGPSSPVVKVQVSDGRHTVVAQATVTVNNVAPTVSASFASLNTSCGANNSTLNVSFTDPGVADTHTAVVDWGDGSTENVGTVTSPFSLQHTYAMVGTDTATVTVTDDDGGAGTKTATTTVNYNTSGVLDPINSNGKSVFKYLSTIPVKVRFTNCDGSIPTDLAPTLKVTMVSGDTPGLEINEPVSTSAADTNGVMRFSTDQYIYNLATKPLPDSSATYKITITVPSTGQTVIVNFGLKK